MKCDRDCFNCPYPDCIEDEMAAEDYDEARARDREIIFPKTRKEKQIAAKQKAYREANRDEIAAKKKAYYEANRDVIAAKRKAYREKYNAYLRQYQPERRMQHGQN